jgi:two-component system sensor histidine kinase/response regulator
VKSSADSLLTLINDILDFSKIEAGRLEIEPIEFSLRDCLDETVRILAVRAHGKGLELVCHVVPGVPDAVVGDPGRLRQVLFNLIGNAIKFTENGEVVVRVEAAPPEGDRVEIRFAVSDTGIGIPESKHQSIFEAFTQADGSTTRRYGGTGLGLTISSQLVEMMGGQIRVDSQVGSGSTFLFHVRLGLQRGQAPQPAATLPEGLEGLRVLVVDDHATNRRILEEMFEGWRMQPVAVDGGPAALRALKSAARRGQPFRLAILDAHMPGMDGFMLAERIQKDRLLRGVELIMLTSGGQRGEAARSRQAGISAYLTKPMRRSELLDLIMTVLAPKATERPNRLITRHSLREEKRRLRVLLVEDNPVNRAVAVRMLERRGHTVTVATGGREAVEMSGKRPFDVALMDLQMPEMGGLEATAAIRERERSTGKRLPIVAMTAHAMKSDRERCLRAGMDGYVSKPIQAASLFEAIESILSTPPIERAVLVPAATEVEPTNAPLLDRRALMERLEGDAGLLAEIVDLFLKSAPGMMRDIQEGLARRDAGALERAAHALKGSVANFGARAAFEAALRMERLAQEGDLTGARAAWAPLEKEVVRLKRALAKLAEEHAA